MEQGQDGFGGKSLGDASMIIWVRLIENQQVCLFTFVLSLLSLEVADHESQQKKGYATSVIAGKKQSLAPTHQQSDDSGLNSLKLEPFALVFLLLCSPQFHHGFNSV